MSGTAASRTIVVDANLLINLLHVGRLALLAALPGYECVVPEDVVAEITDPSQREQIDRAVVGGQLRVETITDFDDLVEYAELRRTLGRGEAACLVLAARHGWLVASDEKGRFQREASARRRPNREYRRAVRGRDTGGVDLSRRCGSSQIDFGTTSVPSAVQVFRRRSGSAVSDQIFA